MCLFILHLLHIPNQPRCICRTPALTKTHATPKHSSKSTKKNRQKKQINITKTTPHPTSKLTKIHEKPSHHTRTHQNPRKNRQKKQINITKTTPHPTPKLTKIHEKTGHHTRTHQNPRKNRPPHKNSQKSTKKQAKKNK